MHRQPRATDTKPAWQQSVKLWLREHVGSTPSRCTNFRDVKLTANLPVSKTGYQSSNLCIPANQSKSEGGRMKDESDAIRT